MPRLRDCPRCQVHLAPRALPVPEGGGTVEADACPSCGGLFLDQGELGALAARRDLERLLAADAVEDDSDFGCPACGEGMGEAPLLGFHAGVDVCRACGGVWLDPGELALARDAGAESGRLPGGRPRWTPPIPEDPARHAVALAFMQLASGLPGARRFS